MATINKSIAIYGDPILRSIANKVEEVNYATRQLVTKMLMTTKQYRCLGLAAPQIGVSKRVIVVDSSVMEQPHPLVLINPELIERTPEQIPFEEGCLSIPNVEYMIYRPAQVVVQGYGLNGKLLTFNARGILSRVLQHEIDHLNGVLFTDYITEPGAQDHIERLIQTPRINLPRHTPIL